MLITRDYLKVSPWTAIIDMINDACFTQIVAGSTTLESFESLGGTKTKIVINTKRSSDPNNSMPEVKLDTYTYDRLDLSTFFRQTQVLTITGVDTPFSSVDIVESLSALNDIVFDIDDFIHGIYDKFNEEYILRANPRSLRFVGFLRISLTNTIRQDISKITAKREFPKANYLDNVDADNDKINATYYVTGYDFSEFRDYLRVLTKEGVYPDAKRMAALLEDVSGKPWTTSTEPKEHNIINNVSNIVPQYTVFYNGPVLPRYSPRTDIQNVLILQLSDTLCTDVVGKLLIHYN